MNLDMNDEVDLLKFKVKKVRSKNRKHNNHLLNSSLDRDAAAKRKTKVSKEDKRNIFYITKALD